MTEKNLISDLHFSGRISERFSTNLQKDINTIVSRLRSRLHTSFRSTYSVGSGKQPSLDDSFFCLSFTHAQLSIIPCFLQEPHVNTCYKHFYFFVTEHHLVTLRELEPLVSLYSRLALLMRFLFILFAERNDREDDRRAWCIASNEAEAGAAECALIIFDSTLNRCILRSVKFKLVCEAGNIGSVSCNFFVKIAIISCIFCHFFFMHYNIYDNCFECHVFEFA